MNQSTRQRLAKSRMSPFLLAFVSIVFFAGSEARATFLNRVILDDTLFFHEAVILWTTPTNEPLASEFQISPNWRWSITPIEFDGVVDILEFKAWHRTVPHPELLEQPDNGELLIPVVDAALTFFPTPLPGAPGVVFSTDLFHLNSTHKDTLTVQFDAFIAGGVGTDSNSPAGAGGTVKISILLDHDQGRTIPTGGFLFPIPEPTAVTLATLALGGLMLARRRRQILILGKSQTAQQSTIIKNSATNE